MQTYNRQNELTANTKTKRRLWQPKDLLPLVVLLLLCTASFAQEQSLSAASTSPKPPLSTAMSGTSFPVVGNGFYEPGAVFRLTALHGEASSFAAKQLPSRALDETLDETSKDGAGSNAGDPLDLPSAADLCALREAGSLAEIEQQLLTSYLANASVEAGEILLQLLDTIVQIKADSSYTVRSDMSKGGARKAQLVRFKIGGQDVLESCAALYTSPTQEGMAFLLSVDIKQTDDAAAETLHMLFKPAGEFLHYTVAAQAVCSGEGEGGIAKEFAPPSDMEAFRTGNFVSLKSTGGSINVDVLIDLGDEAN